MDILIAEDEKMSRMLVRAVLQQAGHTVTDVANGQEAWDTWVTARPRLVISDWLMPGMDGLELCRRLRAIRGEPYTYFILLTGKSGRENFLEAMAAEVDDFMSKPVDAAELNARVGVAERIIGLRKELHFLERLLPICSYCKQIREGQKQWVPLDRYVQQHADVALSHGICPTCYAERVQPQIDELEKR